MSRDRLRRLQARLPRAVRLRGPGRRLRRAGRDRGPDRGVAERCRLRRDAPVGPAPGGGPLPALRSRGDRDAQRGDRSAGRLLGLAPLPRPRAARRRAGARAPVPARLSGVPVAREVGRGRGPSPWPSPRSAGRGDLTCRSGLASLPLAGEGRGEGRPWRAAALRRAALVFLPSACGIGSPSGGGAADFFALLALRLLAALGLRLLAPSAFGLRLASSRLGLALRAFAALRLALGRASRSGAGLMSSGSGWVWTFSSVAEQPELDAAVLLLARPWSRCRRSACRARSRPCRCGSRRCPPRPGTASPPRRACATASC